MDLRNFSEFTPVTRGREQTRTRVCVQQTRTRVRVPSKSVFTPRGLPGKLETLGRGWRCEEGDDRNRETRRRGFNVARAPGFVSWRVASGAMFGTQGQGGVSGQKSWAEVAQGAGADRKPRESSHSRASWRVCGLSGWNCRQTEALTRRPASRQAMVTMRRD